MFNATGKYNNHSGKDASASVSFLVFSMLISVGFDIAYL